MSRGRGLGWLAAAALVLAGAIYGYAAAQRGWFPDGWLRERLVAEPEVPGDASGVEEADEPASQGERAAAQRAEEADRLPGLWHLAERAGTEGLALDRSDLEDLADLPYLAGYESAPEMESVTVHDPSRAFQGLNLVVSGHAPQAMLLDMEGRVVHQWSKRLETVWPELAAERDLKHFDTFWRRAQLLPNGDLLAIYDGIGLIKLDADSNLLWGFPGRAHHDIHVADDGTIYTLTRRSRRRHPALELDGPIEEDFVTRLTADGEVIDHLSVLDSLASSAYAPLLSFSRPRGDILHTNTLAPMDGRFADRHPLYRRGNLLISIPRLDTVAVIDPRRAEVVWALTGLFGFQHEPTVVSGGNLLVFDNTGEGGNSKVVEIDPLTQEIVWAYRGTAERPLSSYFLGSCQRLPNGNTLITESTAGRGLEVTPAGEIVWEYFNPFRAGEDHRLIASLLEVVRIDPGSLDDPFRSRLEPSAR